MTYPISFTAKTKDGTKLGMVYLPHTPEDADKIITIRAAMLKGAAIRPVILLNAGDHHMAFSGAHRIAAAQGLDDVLAAVYLPDDLTPEQFAFIDAAHDDDDLLAAIEQVATERGDMEEVVEAMRAEVAANNA